MEADLLFRRRWCGKRGRIEDLHQLPQHLNDRSFMSVQARSQLFLKRREFFGEIACAEQRLAHFDESANDEHTHLNGLLATKNIRSLQGTVLSKGIRPFDARRVL